MQIPSSVSSSWCLWVHHWNSSSVDATIARDVYSCQFSCYKLSYIEIIIDSRAVVGNNTRASMCPLLVSPQPYSSSNTVWEPEYGHGCDPSILLRFPQFCLWGHRETTAIYTPNRDTSGGSNPTHTWISDFQPPGLGEINVYCLRDLVWGALLWQLKKTHPSVLRVLYQAVSFCLWMSSGLSTICWKDHPFSKALPLHLVKPLPSFTGNSRCPCPGYWKMK